MKLLIVSDFEYNPNSGAAGSLISIGNQIEGLGHAVKYIWRKEERYIKSNNYSRFFELPYIQFQQIKNAMLKEYFDVVVISQPHAWLAVKKLKKEYPKTVFINRTHGWELRIEEASKKLDSNSSTVQELKNKITLGLLKHCSYLTVKYCDAILCASADDENFIKKQYPRWRDKIYKISYGLDSDYIGIRDAKFNNQKINFLFAGQYLPRKGVGDIKNVFARLTDRTSEFVLTFIVDPSSTEVVANDFKFLPPASLNIKTWVSRKELIDVYLNNDIFLMPSYGEGFGKTTIEAMACRLCVLGYKEAALLDFGRDRINALLCETGDIKKLHDNIEFSLNNYDIIKSYGRQAWEDVQKQTWHKNAEETIELFDRLRFL